MHGDLSAGQTGVPEGGAAEAQAGLLLAHQALMPAQPARLCCEPDPLPVLEKVSALEGEGRTQKQLGITSPTTTTMGTVMRGVQE